MSPTKNYLLFKPFGYISQFVYNGQRKSNKKMLGELFDFAPGTMAIGRLDEDSEGLLLLTTDGKVSFEILSRKFEKEYHVQVDGLLTDEALLKLQSGVEIGVHGQRYNTLPCTAKKLEHVDFPERGKKIRDERHGPTSWVSITVREGKFRQVRKMTAAVGFPTLRLVRVRIGAHVLGDLSPGQLAEIESFL